MNNRKVLSLVRFFTLFVGLFVGVAQASSVVSSFVEEVSGTYTRTVPVTGNSGSTLTVDDVEVNAKDIEQVLTIKAISKEKAKVSFRISSGEGSRPSCNGEEIFRVGADGKSLVYGFDLEDGTDQAGDFNTSCSMSLSKGNSGSLEFKSSASCKVEMCGAGNTLDQDGNLTIFQKN